MAEESKQSELQGDNSASSSSSRSISLEENLPDLEESLDFDIYVDDIPLIADGIVSGISQSIDESSIKNVIHFSDHGSDTSGPIPLNLSSFSESESNDYSELGSKSFSEDDLDNILLKDSNDSEFGEEESIALSPNELDNITSDNEDYSLDDSYAQDNEQIAPDDLNDTYDTELDDETNITLGRDELDNILNPDEEDSEDDFDGSSFFDNDSDSEAEETDESIALSVDELNNITDSDYSSNEDLIGEQPSDLFDESSEEEIALSGDELNNLLDSGDIIEEENEKSFFDSEEEGDESIALSPDELSKITDSEYPVEDGIETDDLSSGIESNEYGVSTEDILDEEIPEDEDISLSGDELNDILETGEMEVEDDFEEDIDGDNVKSFFDSDEEDESIALSSDELGDITSNEDFESEEIDEAGDNFDLSDSTEDLDMDSSSTLFDENDADDQEIALSGDELSNLIESGEIETEEDESSGSSFFEDSAVEDESIALSPDELSNITAEEDFEIDTLDSAEDSVAKEDNFDLFDNTDDLEIGPSPDLFEENGLDNEEIALSGDELNNLIESGDLETENDESSGSSFFEDSEEDESIALSPDELGNITAEQDTEEESLESSMDSLYDEDNFDLPDSSDDLQSDSTSDLFSGSDASDEEISLSGDELENLLESGDVVHEEQEDSFDSGAQDNPIDSGMVIGEDDFVLDDNSSLPELEDFNSEDSSIDEDSSDYSDKLQSFQFGSVKKEELAKVISYMDELLGSLPDSYIKEFASSEYFELYKKIMNELEL